MFKKLGEFYKSQLIYDLRPYLYLAIGFYGLINTKLSVANAIFGVSLVSCAALILYMRTTYRRSLSRIRPGAWAHTPRATKRDS